MPYTDEELQEFLEHHGVKGMHWGVRKERTAEEQSAHDRHVHTAKKVAVVAGSVAAVALVAGGTYYVAKHGGLPISSFSSATTSAGKSIVEDLVKPSIHEPTSPIHGTGAGYLPDRTHRTGGVPDVFTEFKRAGLANEYADMTPAPFFRRYGTNLEKVAVAFDDPQGRKDFAGRPIVHRIVIPAQHAADVTDHAGAQRRAWELLGKSYNEFSDYANRREATNEEARRLGLMD